MYDDVYYMLCKRLWMEATTTETHKRMNVAWSVRWCVKVKYFYELSKHICWHHFVFVFNEQTEWNMTGMWYWRRWWHERRRRRQRCRGATYNFRSACVIIVQCIYRCLEVSAYARIPHICVYRYLKNVCFYCWRTNTHAHTHTPAFITTTTTTNSNKIDDSNCNGEKYI